VRTGPGRALVLAPDGKTTVPESELHTFLAK